jgi:hypothetical protein
LAGYGFEDKVGEYKLNRRSIDLFFGRMALFALLVYGIGFPLASDMKIRTYGQPIDPFY